jgi:hypothetical protein
MKYANIREEELKNKVAKDYFWTYDCSKIIGNVDFCVAMHHTESELFEQESLLWAEAKKGSADSYTSIVQLILTIGKARSFDKHLPPPFLGAFDGEKIAFIPYADIHEVFYQNDFNWNVTPSNHESKEFQSLLAKVTATIEQKALLYYFERDGKELERFIKDNFQVGKFGVTKIKIDKNNFMVVYNKWLQSVKPTVAVNWDIAKKSGIIDGDFYLADLLSQDNKSLKDKLFVLLKNDFYELDRQVDAAGFSSIKTIQFNDKQVAHTQFWNKHERPPKREYWDYIVERRDLLVPQDVRERKGSYFTPQVWVELSQRYITDVLGEDWQDEYFVWDCAAGTGNLLFGLTNKYNVWASTLDTQDVEVMRDRIKNGANLLENHIFQFDFLNDDFTKLPQPLQDIINDPEKRKKLVIYINPPYAEATSSKTIGNTDSRHKQSVAESRIKERYGTLLNQGAKELFVQFLFRVYIEIQGAYIANFSKIKTLQGTHYKELRQNFSPNLEKLFIVPSYTFDNVSGHFPIGFFIWNTQIKKTFESVSTDIYDEDANFIGTKTILVTPDKNIKDWLRNYSTATEKIGYLVRGSADVQNSNIVFVTLKPSDSVLKASNASQISKTNLFENAVFVSVRKVIAKTWINDRDQYLYPRSSWEDDIDFRNDCLTFALFDQSNTVKSSDGINHWIPFTEEEVNAREKFTSDFMSNFIKGKIKPDDAVDLFAVNQPKAHYEVALKFSPEATAVFDAGRALWTYYHAQPQCNVNASLYDIREHFQGRNDKGKMNNKSSDEVYSSHIAELRSALKLLAQKIEPKVYEHGFLL